jgi:hypothetical protein
MQVGDELLCAIKAAVYGRVSRAIAEDVVQEIAIAVLCGELPESEIGRSVPRFARKATSENVSFSLSLDAPILGLGGKTIAANVDKKGFVAGDRERYVSRQLHNKKRAIGVRGSLLWHQIRLPDQVPSMRRRCLGKPKRRIEGYWRKRLPELGIHLCDGSTS